MTLISCAAAPVSVQRSEHDGIGHEVSDNPKPAFRLCRSASADGAGRFDRVVSSHSLSPSVEHSRIAA